MDIVRTIEGVGSEEGPTSQKVTIDNAGQL
jgi:hypothetical protein